MSKNELNEKDTQMVRDFVGFWNLEELKKVVKGESEFMEAMRDINLELLRKEDPGYVGGLNSSYDAKLVFEDIIKAIDNFNSAYHIVNMMLSHWESIKREDQV